MHFSLQKRLIKKLLPLLATGQQSAAMQELHNIEREQEDSEKAHQKNQKALMQKYKQTVNNASHGPTT